MKRILIVMLGAALAGGACGTTASDATDIPLRAENDTAAGTFALPSLAAYREVTIPAGTTLPLALSTPVSSETSRVEDAVSAALITPIAIDGRNVLPAGTRLSGVVTGVEDSGRVKGRAMIAFRFTTLSTGDRRYDVESEPLSHLAAATKSEDATKIGIGAGAGAVIGGILGGTKGAATGAVVGGGAGTGVVLATKGRDVRLVQGADVTTRLTAPLTVRVPRS